MATHEIKHFRAQNFTSGVATGISLAGPTPDEFFHLLFFRDAFLSTSEVFEAETITNEDGQQQGLRLKIPDDPSLNTATLAREEIAQIALSEVRLRQLRDMLNAQLAKLDEAAK